MKSFRRCIKAVSPVIATIIIVAIAITMSIAVAYWVLGLGSSFTKYEKVEFTSAYADYGTDNYTISMVLKNTGSAAATVSFETIFFNGKPAIAPAYALAIPTANFTSFTMIPGNTTSNLAIYLPNTSNVWQSGMTIEVMIQSAAGKQYPKVITLP
jgi:hypothetical protein